MSTECEQDTDRRRPIRVVLVDDEQLIRVALAHVLATEGLELVGEASTGEQALEIVLEERPDVVLIDVRLPGISGVETIEQLSVLVPTARVLVLARSERNQVVEAIIAGASGYILKSAAPEAIVNAVRATAFGECVLSSQVAGKLLDHIRETGIPVHGGSQVSATEVRAVLTTRELEVFQQLASGKNNQQIGRELSLSAHTISNHVKSILAKLHFENRVQAAAHAVRTGIS